MLKDWENPQIQSINRPYTHSLLGAYSNINDALSNDRYSGKYVKSLCGSWCFKLYDSPESVPVNFKDRDYDRCSWDAVKVPGCWELMGYFPPVYVNMRYPFPYELGTGPHLRQAQHEFGCLNNVMLSPPRVPAVGNYTGCYVKPFTIPQEWRGRRTYITFEGVESCYYLWLNGKLVGFAKDSKLPSEFELTEFLCEGENILAVQVLRWSDASYLEKQDYWHLSGIIRPVYISSRPVVSIQDISITAGYDKKTGGDFSLYVQIDECDNPENYSINYELIDEDGGIICAGHSPPVSSASPMYGDIAKLTYNANVAENRLRVMPWNPDAPKLYRLKLTLTTTNHVQCDFQVIKVGFRTVKINKNNVITLNGRRLVIRGVNRHDHHHETGRFVSAEWMRKEIKEMKKLHFNAVRTCHYPSTPQWFDLCDEMGMLVVCECNLETHGLASRLSKNPEWSEAYLTRARRMAQTYKNHPSIIIWSLGNESGAGANHAAMSGFLRYYDPSRPIQYESGDPNALISDIRAPMYPKLDWVTDEISKNIDKRPIVMCEYAYAKSNSNGNFFKFWDLIDKYERFQGGFIWDWSDKALKIRGADGSEYWGYGGDFGEQVTDPVPDMCLNGVVAPDLTWHPAAWEIRHCQSPLQIKAVDIGSGKFLIKNDSFALNEVLKLTAVFFADGIPFAKKESSFKTAACRSKVFQTSYPVFPSGEISVIFSINCRGLFQELPYYEQQFLLREGYAVPACPAPSPLFCHQLNQLIEFKGENWHGTFDSNSGTWNDIYFQERLIFSQSPKEHLFRAFTGIDEGCGINDRNFDSYANSWRRAGLDNYQREVLSCKFEQLNDSSAVIKITALLFGCIQSRLTIEINGNGYFAFHNQIDIPQDFPPLPRIGFNLILDSNMKNILYYGRGPHENYCDRKHSAFLRCYQSSVTAQHYPYIVPVENGGKEDVRLLQMYDDTGIGIEISAMNPFHFSAHNYSDYALQNARHQQEIVQQQEIYLNVDFAHSGLGGDTGWYKNIHPEFLLSNKKYSWQWNAALKKFRNNAKK